MSGIAQILRGSNLATCALGLTAAFSAQTFAQQLPPLDLSAISREALREDLRREILTRERMGLPPVGEDRPVPASVAREASSSSSQPCRKYDRRSLVSYTSDDGALRSGVRLRRNQLMLEFSYTFDGDVKLSPGDHCRPMPNWQGWGAIIYREAAGDKDRENPTRSDLIREVDEERYRKNRGITNVPSQIPAPTE